MNKVFIVTAICFCFISSNSLLGVSVINVPNLSDAKIKIDGRFDEKNWQQAAKYTGMIKLGKFIPAKADSELRIFYSKGKLHIGMIAYEPAPKKLRRSITGKVPGEIPVTMLENDDVLEFFIVQGQRYNAHAAINPNNAPWFSGVRPSMLLYTNWQQPRLLSTKWELQWQHAVFIGDNFWSAEVVVDTSDFENFANIKEPWQFNFCRERRTKLWEFSSIGALPGKSFPRAVQHFPVMIIEGIHDPALAKKLPKTPMLYPKKIHDWQVKGANVIGENGKFKVRGKSKMISKDFLLINPKLRYRLSGEFRSKSKKTISLYFGLVMSDNKRKQILPHEVIARPQTLTKLTRAVGPGDKEIYVHDGSKWHCNSLSFVAFNAKKDLSDLPNRQLNLYGGINQKEKIGNEYRLKFNSPMRHNMPAGTLVREHKTGAAYYYYSSAPIVIKENWKKFSTVISGYPENAHLYARYFWPGTSYVQLLLWALGSNNKQTLEFRNVTFTEEK